MSMKTFSATDARNKFGEFLDSGMVEGVKVVRNNRVLGYFVPEREYEELKRAAGAGVRAAASPAAGLGPAQMETLALYSQGKVTSTEARADLGCDRRGLMALLAQHGFLLPRVDRSRAEAMARGALEALGVPVENRLTERAPSGAAARG